MRRREQRPGQRCNTTQTRTPLDPPGTALDQEAPISRASSPARPQAQMTVARDRHRSAFLRDDDAERVAAFGEAERGGVPGAAGAELLEVARERQVQREAHDAVALDRDRAVVTRRVRIEEREQQRLREQAAERDAARDVAIERLAARNHEKRADALRGAAARAHQRVHRIGGAAAGLR
jgi:hypothetical protein